MSAQHAMRRHDSLSKEYQAGDGERASAGAAWDGGWGAVRGGEDEDYRRESLNSNLSDEDWEVVQKRDSVSTDPSDVAGGRSMGGVGLPSDVLARAGDWLQWGLDGAVKGVEKTCDGIKGVW